MKRFLLITLAIVFLFPFGLSLSKADAATLNLRATWTANTEPDMKEYRLYRTDGTRTLIGTIQHPTVLYNFVLTVPDNSDGTATFVLTAVDLALNESLDSVTVPFVWSLKAPVAPSGLGISKQ